jgi:hypothetical protein
MPSRIHEGGFRILAIVREAVVQALTIQGFGCQINLGNIGTVRLYNRNNRGLLNRRESDGCLIIKIPGVRLSRLPYVVLEIAYSESYVELLRDARAWLTERDNEVLAVIVVKVSKPRVFNFNPDDWKIFTEVWERDS